MQCSTQQLPLPAHTSPALLPPSPPDKQSQPDDFRAYLAKGLLLKDQGRAGDATRYFIQVCWFVSAPFGGRGGGRTAERGWGCTAMLC